MEGLMKDDCNLEDINWSEQPLDEVLAAADDGILSAIKEVKIRLS